MEKKDKLLSFHYIFDTTLTQQWGQAPLSAHPIQQSANFYTVLLLTSIYISHRLASTRFCDRIILLDKSQIAEEGTHKELIEKNGHYAEMFFVQSQYYSD